MKYKSESYAAERRGLYKWSLFWKSGQTRPHPVAYLCLGSSCRRTYSFGALTRAAQLAANSAITREPAQPSHLLQSTSVEEEAPGSGAAATAGGGASSYFNPALRSSGSGYSFSFTQGGANNGPPYCRLTTSSTPITSMRVRRAKLARDTEARQKAARLIF